MTQGQTSAEKRIAERLVPTLSLPEAARTTWDAVVAGAGPAGSVTAYLLARRGCSVLLADKADFPRDKVCGSCLNAAALRTLEVVGLGHLPRALGAVRLNQMRIRAGGSGATLPLPAGAAISRRALDAALVRAAIEAGAAFLPRTEAALVTDASTLRTTDLRSGEQSATVSARCVVAADGLGGGFLEGLESMAPNIARHAPLGVGALVEDAAECYPAGTIHMGCTQSGYAGIVRLKDGRVDVAAALDRGTAQKAGGAAAAVAAILEQSGLPRPSGLADASFRGTPYLTRTRRNVAAWGVIAIGDAAGYVEPFTGEGMAWALQQAVLAAPLAGETVLRRDPAQALRWQVRVRAIFPPPQQRLPSCRVAPSPLLVRTLRAGSAGWHARSGRSLGPNRE